jgi:hypothetical protein
MLNSTDATYCCFYCCGLRKSTPGPAKLNMMIEAAGAFTNAHRPLPPPKKSKNHSNTRQQQSTSTTSQANIDPSSVNAVVRLLELGDEQESTTRCQRRQSIQQQQM